MEVLGVVASGEVGGVEAQEGGGDPKLDEGALDEPRAESTCTWLFPPALFKPTPPELSLPEVERWRMPLVVVVDFDTTPKDRIKLNI